MESNFQCHFVLRIIVDSLLIEASAWIIWNSATFNGTSSKIDIWNSSTLDISSGNMTWNFWCNLTSLANFKTFFRRWTANVNWYYIYLDASKVTFASNQSWTQQVVACSNTLSTNTTTMVTVSKNWTSIEFYINWVSINSASISNPTTSTSNLIIWQYDNSNVTSWWLDEIWIYDLLTPTEITELYNSWNWLSYPF